MLFFFYAKHLFHIAKLWWDYNSIESACGESKRRNDSCLIWNVSIQYSNVTIVCYHQYNRSRLRYEEPNIKFNFSQSGISERFIVSESSLVPSSESCYQDETKKDSNITKRYYITV